MGSGGLWVTGGPGVKGVCVLEKCVSVVVCVVVDTIGGLSDSPIPNIPPVLTPELPKVLELTASSPLTGWASFDNITPAKKEKQNYEYNISDNYWFGYWFRINM